MPKQDKDAWQHHPRSADASLHAVPFYKGLSALQKLSIEKHVFVMPKQLLHDVLVGREAALKAKWIMARKALWECCASCRLHHVYPKFTKRLPKKCLNLVKNGDAGIAIRHSQERILFYDAGSRNGLDGVGNRVTVTQKEVVPKEKHMFLL